MRETDLNQNIERTEIKVGDTIVVSRKMTVKNVRYTTIHAGVGKPRRPITIVTSEDNTIGVTDDESVTLMERDKEPLFIIPAAAIIVTWRDDDGYDYIARRNDVSDEWVTSSNGPNTTYTTDALVRAIEEGDFDGYQEGSFEVLKRAPRFVDGGHVGGVALTQPSIDALKRLAQQNILPRNVLASAGLAP